VIPQLLHLVEALVWLLFRFFVNDGLGHNISIPLGRPRTSIFRGCSNKRISETAGLSAGQEEVEFKCLLPSTPV
jgi:hypothetical protein